MTLDSIRAEANRIGFEIWASVLYKGMAEGIRDRLNAEQPGAMASIGLVPNDSPTVGGDMAYTIWYKPAGCTWHS